MKCIKTSIYALFYLFTLIETDNRLKSLYASLGNTFFIVLKLTEKIGMSLKSEKRNDKFQDLLWITLGNGFLARLNLNLKCRFYKQMSCGV